MRWAILILEMLGLLWLAGCRHSDESTAIITEAMWMNVSGKTADHETRIGSLEQRLPAIAGMAQAGQISGDTAKARVDDLIGRLAPKAGGKIVARQPPLPEGRPENVIADAGQFTDGKGVRWAWKRSAGACCFTNDAGYTYCLKTGTDNYELTGTPASGCSTCTPGASMSGPAFGAGSRAGGGFRVFRRSGCAACGS